MSAVLTDHEIAIAETVAKRSHLPVDGAEVLAEVARIFGVSVERITGPRRDLILADARSVIAYVLRRRAWTNYEIGRLLNRDHSSIYSSLRRLDDDLEIRRLAKELAA